MAANTQLHAYSVLNPTTLEVSYDCLRASSMEKLEKRLQYLYPGQIIVAWPFETVPYMLSKPDREKWMKSLGG